MRVIRRVGSRRLGWRGLGGRLGTIGSVGHIHAHVEVVVLVLLAVLRPRIQDVMRSRLWLL